MPSEPVKTRPFGFLVAYYDAMPRQSYEIEKGSLLLGLYPHCPDNNKTSNGLSCPKLKDCLNKYSISSDYPEISHILCPILD